MLFLKPICLMILLGLYPTVGRGADLANNTYVLAVASSESFDSDLPDLSFPHQDQLRFIQALKDTGGIPDDHFYMLRNPDLKKLREAFAKISRAVTGDKPKFLFYYTGHSDAAGLHLLDGKLTRNELHELFNNVPVLTRIAFLDSCYSGALAKKGIKPAEEFVLPKAEFDEPTGTVFLAATSGDDVAYEIEEIQGSLFTHHLVSGLYGQADANRDGLVTVEEIYQHVYREVRLHNLSLPLPSQQKPEYRIDLKGRGSLVLGSVEQVTTPVTISREVAGEVTFVADNGVQIFRFQKPEGQEMTVNIPRGTYRTVLRREGWIGKGAVAVNQVQVNLSLQDLVVAKEYDYHQVAKGTRDKSQFNIDFAYHAGLKPYSGAGLAAAAAYQTTGIRLRQTTWRLQAGIHGSRVPITEFNSSGIATIGYAVGGFHVTYNKGLFPSQFWQAHLVGGAGYIDQSYQSKGPGWRLFEDTASKVEAGIAMAFLTPSGSSYGLFYRRQFAFFTIKDKEDVIALGGNLLGLTVTF